MIERLSTYDLREKEVVNVCDGARLGCPTDFEIDCTDGKIISLVLPRQGGFLGLFREDNIIIPWCKIECIGADTVIVRISPEEYRTYESERKKSTRRL